MSRRAHIHLDPVGGIAGDMFVAVLLDLAPELQERLDAFWRAARERGALPDDLLVEAPAGSSGGLAGRRFEVTGPRSSDHQDHAGYTEVEMRLLGLGLAPPVESRATAMLRRLAEVEAEIHGVTVAQVHFHELAGWDTVVDLAAAALLIEALAPTSWSIGSLPLGGGVVRTAHGPLPIPAPATAALLAGFDWIDDGIGGERVTPTGAAILAALRPQLRPSGPMRLVATGYGLGTRELGGVANVVRALRFELDDVPTSESDEVGVIRFEVDDQTPEDLALALDRLRSLPEVKDVCQWPVTGKGGRLGAAVQLLCQPAAVDAVALACLAETATIGLRQRLESRRVLPRQEVRSAGGGPAVGVKRVERPGGELSVKAELADVAAANETYAGRQRLRRIAENSALEEE